MHKKVLHIVLVLLLALAIPFSHVAKPVVIKTTVKEAASKSKEESSSKTFIQPQVFHAQASSAHSLAPCILEHFRYEIAFPQEETQASTVLSLLDKGASKFFKTLFRHFIATQAP